MPKQKDLKRLVRTRQEKTGESYTAARARLLEKAAAAKSAAQEDLAALAGTSDAMVAEKTGRTWKEWVRVLDRAGAAKLEHAAIARIVHEDHGVPGWWSQTVTVGYERIRGLRERGQRRDGTYEVGKSKVYPVPLAELWAGFCRCDLWLAGAKLRMSRATKPKSMRMRWSDGTPVEANFLDKGPRKSQVHIQHRKLASRAEAERMRVFWGQCLARLGQVLTDKG
jgi:hypothetical protein